MIASKIICVIGISIIMIMIEAVGKLEDDRKDEFMKRRIAYYGCSKMAATVEGEWFVMRNQVLPTS